MPHRNEQLKMIKRDFERLMSASKISEKQTIISSMKGTVSGRALRIYLDPNIVFHIDKKTITRDTGLKSGTDYRSIFELCEYLAGKDALTNQDIANVQGFIASLDRAYQDFAVEFIQKSVKLGCAVTTYNKCYPENPIMTVSCMLAHKYFEHPEAVEGKEFVLTTKMDGERCICIKRGDQISFFTRQGKQIEGLAEVEQEVKRIPGDVVLDGELLVKNGLKMASSDAFKRTMRIVRRKGEKKNICYHVFDIMTLAEYADQQTRVYKERRKELDRLSVYFANSLKHLCFVPVIYHGTDTDMIVKANLDAKAAQQEGVMINLVDEPYQFKRTTALLKVKTFCDADLQIVDLEEGEGRNEGSLGALLVDYKGNLVGVGSGFTDKQRREFWLNKEQIVGRIARVSYFEETQDKSGSISLRFPTFVDLCDAGKEVSY